MIIGFSGRAQSGKDTSGMIAQILLNSPHLNNTGVKDFLRKQVDPDNTYYSNWEIKKFADKLKDMTCLLIGCTREQLEDETFKNTHLGEEWDKWEVYNPTCLSDDQPYKTFATLEEAEECKALFTMESWSVEMQVRKIRMTPRLLLQLIGTECGRNILHPNIWVNSTMVDYKPTNVATDGFIHSVNNETGMKLSVQPNPILFPEELIYPDWIITDMRFPNEAVAIKQKKGILVRIERPWFYTLLKDGKHEFSDKEDRTGHVYKMSSKYSKEEAEVLYQKDYKEKVHASETALDDYEGFNYLIFNGTTIDDLINAIRNILIGEGLLTKD